MQVTRAPDGLDRFPIVDFQARSAGRLRRTVLYGLLIVREVACLDGKQRVNNVLRFPPYYLPYRVLSVSRMPHRSTTRGFVYVASKPSQQSPHTQPFGRDEGCLSVAERRPNRLASASPSRRHSTSHQIRRPAATEPVSSTLLHTARINGRTRHDRLSRKNSRIYIAGFLGITPLPTSCLGSQIQMVR